MLGCFNPELKQLHVWIRSFLIHTEIYSVQVCICVFICRTEFIVLYHCIDVSVK